MEAFSAVFDAEVYGVPPDITRHVSEEAERIAREVPDWRSCDPWKSKQGSREIDVCSALFGVVNIMIRWWFAKDL